MTIEEFVTKLRTFNWDIDSKVLVNHPDALHDGRDTINVDSIDIDGDGNLVIWADE